MTEIHIADVNFRLAVLDEVFRDRVGDYYWLRSLREEYARYQASAGGPTWEVVERRLGVDYLPELEGFLLMLPLSSEDLAALTDLELDGDREIYTLHPDWWHDDRRFTITDLSGIEHCSAITRLNLGQGMFDGCSLVPLVELTALRHLGMSALDNHRDLDALVSLPALTDLEVGNVATAGDRERWRSVIAELRARGVTVDAR